MDWAKGLIWANIIDKHVEQLSKMQVELLAAKMSADDYNEMSEMIGNLKEFMINCPSYKQNK